MKCPSPFSILWADQDSNLENACWLRSCSPNPERSERVWKLRHVSADTKISASTNSAICPNLQLSCLPWKASRLYGQCSVPVKRFSTRFFGVCCPRLPYYAQGGSVEPPATKKERMKGFEPSTSTLARSRSTTELHPQEAQGGRARVNSTSTTLSGSKALPVRRDVAGEGFEPSTFGL